MATYTLRPNADWQNQSLFTISGGAPNVYTALSDNSDTTYITRTSTTAPAFYESEFTSQTLASNERVVTVNLRVRIDAGTNPNAEFSIGVITDRNGRVVSYSVPISRVTSDATITTYDLGFNLTSAPNGAPWSQTLLDNLVFKFSDNSTVSADRTILYEVYIDVVTTAQPTVTVTAPSGTVTTTSFPSVVWTYTDTDGDPQSAYQIKIFDSTVYGGAGFSPDTSTALVDTGVVASTNNGATLETDLADATTYRAYVRVAQSVSGSNYFSNWAYSQFSIDVDAPAPPSISAFFDDQEGAVVLTIFGRTNFLSANQASLETNTDGWAAVSNCAIARSTAQASTGSASLEVTATALGDAIVSTTTGTAFAVIANSSFSALCDVRAGTTSRSCQVGIRWLTSGGATISTSYGTAGSDSNSAWTTINVTAVAPATAAKAQVFVKVVNAGAGEVHYVDKIALHAGTSPTWTRGGFSNFSFDVERSTNGSYIAVRNSPVAAGAGQIATLNDYEAPIDATVTYRAKARADI